MNKQEVKIFNKGQNEVPEYGSLFAAGFDFRADFTDKYDATDFKGENYSFNENDRTLYLWSGGRVLVPTGIHIGLPDGYELQVRPRSGLAINSGISVVNSPGTVDADYRGEICIILINTSSKDFVISQGDRIAQGVLKQVEQVEWCVVNSIEELGDTERGQDGFGSTGKK